MMRTIVYSIFVIALLFGSCQLEQTPDGKAIYQLPALTDAGNLNVVVEIPAGTNHKIEFDVTEKAFKNDQLNGQDRVINFLPYPGNYGFIPSTLMDKNRGGDGDALDILVIGESQATGSVVESKPIAALMLKDGDEIDTKIIAVPVDSTLQVFQVEDFTDFSVRCSPAKYMVEQWFTNYKGLGQMEFLGWRDEKYAMDEVQKWKRDPEK